MKEVTHKDWQKNNTPRMMLVWDSDPANASERKVIYISDKNVVYPVVTISKNETVEARFKHCAEIEKQRRMTNKELSRWLREKPTREFTSDINSNVYCYHVYREAFANDEVADTILIREDDGEWREPLVEVGE